MLKPNKKSKYYHMAHSKDLISDGKYDYHGQVLKHTLSPEMFSNDDQNLIFEQMEKLINFLIDEVKAIKLHFSIAHSKNDIRIN
jgi:hypothetical protein